MWGGCVPQKQELDVPAGRKAAGWEMSLSSARLHSPEAQGCPPSQLLGIPGLPRALHSPRAPQTEPPWLWGQGLQGVKSRVWLPCGISVSAPDGINGIILHGLGTPTCARTCTAPQPSSGPARAGDTHRGAVAGQGTPWHPNSWAGCDIWRAGSYQS